MAGCAADAVAGRSDSETVAHWVAGPAPVQAPAAIRERATDLLLDTLGVGIAAGALPAAGIAYEMAAAQFGAGEPPATLAFDGRRVSPAGAAWALATRIDNLDAHDGYQPAKGHAGAALVPALLAAAEAWRPDADGEEALAALVAGYEIACRAATALHAGAGDYHSSGAWNALGAAALVGRLRRLDADTIAAALGIAEYHAPRAPMMREIDAPSMLHDSSGWGALAGVTAVDLAVRGFAASAAELPAVEGPWSDLGRTWLVPEQYVKPHPVCFWAQPAVTAALRLRREHSVDPAAIRRVRLSTFHEATRLFAGVPADTQTAQYALAFPVAAALAHGRLDPPQISGPGLADPATCELVGRIAVEEDPALSARFPAARLAVITLELADGRVLASPPTEPRGTPADPLDRAAIGAKFHAYADPVLGDERAHAIAASIHDLAAGRSSLGNLLERVRPPVA